jgi:uncharacterized membrane protein
MSPQLSPRSTRFLLSASPIGILLVAFALRVHRLADANIWWDEGWTLWLSRFDLASIALRTARDEHPPLHYWLMHFWNFIAGNDASTEAFVGRFFSVFFGVLMVAVVYRLTRRFGGAFIAALAALVLAVARFHIWWSQDIKNYTLSGFFAWLAVWCALEMLMSDAPATSGKRAGLWNLLSGNRFILGYVLSMTLALYSHYLAALILLAVNLFAAIVIARSLIEEKGLAHTATPRAGKLALDWIIAQVAVIILFAPWMYLYLQNAASWTAAPAFDFGLFLRLVATVFPLGITTNIESYTPAMLALTVIVLLASLWLAQKPTSRGIQSSISSVSSLSLFAFVVVLAPPLLIYVLSLTPASFFAPKIQARYLLILLPGYALLLASGIAFLTRLSKYLGLIAGVFILITQAWTLQDYFQARLLRDEYFTLVNFINSFALGGDVALLHTDQEYPTYLYYQRARIAWSGVPNAMPVSEKEAEDLVNYLAERFDGVWLVSIPDALVRDPQHRVEQQLERKFPKQLDREFGDKRLTLFARATHNLKDVPPENFNAQNSRNDEFAPDLRLIGFDLPVREARGGDTLRVVTYWAATSPANITLELHDAAGANIKTDTQPISIGAHERIQSDLTLPPRSDGDFSIVARGKLTTRPLATIRVTPRVIPVSANVITNKTNYRLGTSIHLVGFDVPRAELRPGDSLALTLYWSADKPVETSYRVFVHLAGETFNPETNNPLWGQVDRVPVSGELPTSAWEVNEVIPDAYQVQVSPNAPRGEYKLTVGMYAPATGVRLHILDSNGNDHGDEIDLGSIVVK